MLTPLAIGLLAVTFGWTPAEPADGSSEADSYEYHLRLSEADLAALRDGRVDSLSSELPRDLRGVERVRITLGEGTPPRELARRDRESPRRIAAAGALPKHVVAKPVVTPEWDDAAKLVASPTAERRTVYQGQGAFGPGGLTEGFRDGVERTNEFLGDQARGVAEGTRGILERGGQAIRSRTREVLEGTGRALEGDVFGGRPQYAPRAGQQEYPLDRRAAPPAPTAAPSDYLPRRESPMPLRGRAEPAQRESYPERDRFVNDPRFNDEERDLRGPGFVAPEVQDEGLTRSFAERGRPSDQRMTPIPRERAREFDPFANERDFRGGEVARTSAESRGPYPELQREDRENLTPAEAGFPDRSGAPAGAFAPFGPPQSEYRRAAPYYPSRVTAQAPSVTAASAAPVASDAPARSWAGIQDAAPSGASAPSGDTDKSDPREPETGQDVMQTALLVFLTAITCFTLFAYFDLRNRYRMALRGLPNSGFNPAV